MMISQKERDFSLDLYRCLLMLGICLLHSISQAGHNVSWAANMLSWCVPGFMFISGWFGIRFSLAKVIKLFGISLYCAVVFVAFDAHFSDLSGGSYFVRVYAIAKGQWFLNAYVIVMCFAPMVNLAIDRMTVKELYPLVLVAFGWSFATTLPIWRYVPSSPGLTAYSFLTLLGVYVVARFARRAYDEGGHFYELMENKKVLLMIVGMCLIMAAIGLGDYNSPFAITIAGGMLFVVKDCGVASWLGRVCVWLGPSMFSVYLMHSHGQGWGYLQWLQDSLLAWDVPLVVAYLLTALGVFAVCVAADLPRRIVVMLLKRVK